jgi:iron complex transport system ATP-binding protein
LLLDEPFAAMDLAETDRAVRLLRAHVGARAGQGGAAIVVVHDLTLAARCSDRVWLLADGRLAAEGPTREILAPSVLERHFGVRFVSDADGVPIAQLGTQLDTQLDAASGIRGSVPNGAGRGAGERLS